VVDRTIRRRRSVTETGTPEELDSPVGFWWVAAALVVLVGLMAVVALAAVRTAERSNKRESVPQLLVPEETNLPALVAQEDLERRGFVVDLQPEANILIRPGVVVGQEPVAGSKLEQGSRVVLRISSGPPGISVPDVLGLQAPEAARSLSVLGLRSQTVPVFDDKVRPGEVVATSPPSGREVAPAAVVKLSVSQGPRPRVVPQMVGREAASAMADLARAGLTSGRITIRPTNDFPPNQILSTTPPAGSERPPKFPVAVVISGPPSKRTVPDFLGLTAAGVRELAASTGINTDLRSELITPGGPDADRVIAQSVPVGTQVDRDVTVEVVIGLDPTRIAGP